MDSPELISLARQLIAGDISAGEFRHHLSTNNDSIAELPAATIDLDRRRRCGFPEVVYGPGKTIEELCQIVQTLIDHDEPVLATRITAEQAAGLLSAFPQGRYNDVGRTFRVSAEPSTSLVRQSSPQASLQGMGKARGHVAVISAGTGDLPVAEEARE